MAPHPVVARNHEHLQELIKEELFVQGVLADLNHIDVAGIQDFRDLFDESPFQGRIDAWNTSNGTMFARMFSDSALNGDISRWDVSNATDMTAMFRNAAFGGDVSKWNTANVETMESMFQGADTVPTGLEYWNVGNVDTFFRMFRYNTQSLDLSRWQPKTSAYTDSFMDVNSLRQCAVPNFFHWRRSLGAEGTQHTHLTPEWRAHFDTLAPIANGMGLTPMQGARWMQEQWLAGPAMTAPQPQWSLAFGEDA